MDRPLDRSAVLVSSLRWIARIWGAGLFLFWGSFFIEHLIEWYGNPGRLPPASVTLTMAAHLALVIGLLLAWRWEVLGGGIALVAALVFFARVGGPWAGQLLALTCPPALLWIVCGFASRRARTGRRPAAIS